MTDKTVLVAEEPCHTLIYEDNEVRVYKVEIQPHEATLPHCHSADYVSVTLASAEIEDRTWGNATKRILHKRGEIRMTSAGRVHRVRNVSEVPFRSLVIEFKSGGNC